MKPSPRTHLLPILSVLALTLAAQASPAFAGSKIVVKDMDSFFTNGGPELSGMDGWNIAAAETTIKHQVYFSDFEGTNGGWSVVNYRAGQPAAWHLVTGSHACVGNSWWCGNAGLAKGDGYDNNWVQSLRTNVPINLAGTQANKLTFKYKVQTESDADWCWIGIKGSTPGAHYDTLATYSGDFGTACNNATVSISDSFTTVTQPVEIRFFFGSDLTVSAADSLGSYTGWSMDDVKITGKGNIVTFFDDMESGTSKWVAESPNPGSLWHLETAPGISGSATCFFLNTDVWVPFAGTGFGSVPDFCDAMMYSPPMDLTGVFSPNVSGHLLRFQFDDWENLPPTNGIYWALMLSGSNDLATWTPWTNAFGVVFSGGNPQCYERKYVDFDPYIYNITPGDITGILPGTKYLRIGIRLRDYKLNVYDDGGPLRMGYNTEGIYFDNIGIYHIYAIAGVETVSPVPFGAGLGIRKVYPNPFNPQTTIEFSVPTAGPVTVRIYDIHGREVSTLASASMGPGVYRARWDGKDRSGSYAASGVYFARIQGRDQSDTARLMLLK